MSDQQPYELDKRYVVMTEEGSVSGFLDVSIDVDGRPLIRYGGQNDWLLIEQHDDHRYASPQEVAEAIQQIEVSRDAAGNVIPIRLA